MILSGPKDCFGSMKEARIFPVFLHSPRECQKPKKMLGKRVATYSSWKKEAGC